MPRDYKRIQSANVGRMRESRFSITQGNCERRVRELEYAMDRADLTSDPIAIAVIRLTGELMT